MKNFIFKRPKTIRDAVKEYKKTQGSFYFAGGTDLICLMRDEIVKPEKIVDLKNMDELDNRILETENGLRIGALATMSDINNSPLIKKYLPFLADAALYHSSPGIRERATIGGNLCNASPACDMGTPLMVLNAVIITSKGSKERQIPIQKFFKGVKKSALKPGEILKEILIPEYKEVKGIFYKKSRIKMVDLAMVNMTILKKGAEFRVSIGACAPVPLRIKSAERILNRGGDMNDRLFKKIGKVCARNIKPIDDLRGTAEYRREIVTVMVARLLKQLTSGE
ncbi:MAG: xanthine dehydrogenase family protein subunit M [bacterium]|nr:xanthine dehydrogenase family protein subunit M [bacterium]